MVVTTIDWESLSKQQAAGGTPAGSATPPVQRASTPGTPAAGRRATTPTPSPSAATKSASPAGSGAGPRTPRTPSPEVALLAPEPEMSEEAAAYLPTLAARGAAVASFALRSMQVRGLAGGVLAAAANPGLLPWVCFDPRCLPMF